MIMPVRKVSGMKKMWHENFMHENEIYMHKNEISMHKNEISMHKNENFAPKLSLVKIPCMKLCTAQLPMKMSGTKK